ncbi:hypothetical protein [Deinococcus puniceus]|uniref:Uncharacterized protein n=1 Tax=Deinococcus puniceus TaxID=1182568 RepID=A0A172T885_9DEIO|nr:hypothetical protein [Deinococcus puniceus]ANE43164.1 hypothetical protein SU48_04595 [Deinococcus puniceus]
MANSTSLTLADVQQARHLIQASAKLLWPGFYPAQVPLVVYDGQKTVLWGAQPVGAGWQAEQDSWVFPGRHPQVWANTYCLLEDGLLAACLLLPSLPMPCPPTDLAALAVHEAFHVYQHGHSATAWQINELDALTYPATDAEVLMYRAMEMQALQRALTAPPATLPDVAAELLHWREAQAAHLAPEQAAYIRAAERREGLAHYVELSFKAAQPDFPSVDFPSVDFPASAVRLRAYTTGAVYGLLLDRMLDGWKVKVSDEGAALDELLRSVAGTYRPDGLIPPHFQQWATAAAEEEMQHQQRLLHAFETQPGKQLTLRSTANLWPKAFDPMNLKGVGQGRVLHFRFLQFGNGVVEGELMNCSCLTQSSGPHPLSGFQELRLKGVVSVQATPEGWAASGEGISVRGRAGTVSESEHGWLIDC